MTCSTTRPGPLLSTTVSPNSLHLLTSIRDNDHAATRYTSACHDTNAGDRRSSRTIPPKEPASGSPSFRAVRPHPSGEFCPTSRPAAGWGNQPRAGFRPAGRFGGDRRSGQICPDSGSRGRRQRQAPTISARLGMGGPRPPAGNASMAPIKQDQMRGAWTWRCSTWSRHGPPSRRSPILFNFGRTLYRLWQVVTLPAVVETAWVDTGGLG